MAYSDIAALSVDYDFAQRTKAAYAAETIGGTTPTNPEIWQRDHGWEVAAQPGFGDAYASALAGNVERPGNDPAVITDAMILTAIQTIAANESGG